MNGSTSVFTALYNMISALGTAYWEALVMFFNSVFRRPLRFIFRRVRRTVRFFFRCLVMFASPAASSSEKYADDVTRAAKRCVKILFTQPLSLPSVLVYYVKKAISRYEFSFRNIALWVLPLSLMLLVIMGGGVLSQKTVCLEISCEGETLGWVQNEKDFAGAKNEARKRLAYSGGDAVLPTVSYSLALADKNQLTGSDALCEALLDKSTGSGENACGFFVDGELFAVISSEAEGRQVLQKLLSAYDSAESFVVAFAEELEFRQGLFDKDSILTKNEFEKALTGAGGRVVSLRLKDGDTFEGIAASYSMSEEEFFTLNGIDESTLPEAGMTVKAYDRQPVLTLKEVKAEIVAESVDFDRIEIKTNALYSGTSRVISEGKKGYDQVTNLVTYIDGEKAAFTEASRLSVTKPVAERVQVGTKPLDEAYSNSMGGIFLWPIIGAYGINSDYGWRWGKLHAGIDLGMGNAAGTSLGKTIIAVAQGTVLVAGTHSSYGYYVIIDHGGGLQTLYAHCLANSLMVIPGQIVAAGEPIARVGSTGYSTGPHLHFEVRVNGNRVNPRPYLGI